MVGRSSNRSAHIVPLQLVIFHCFLLGRFLTHAELPAYRSLLPCGKTPIARSPLGRYFWRTARRLAPFWLIAFLHLRFVFRLVVFCSRYYRLVFFEICFPYIGCRFITGFRLAIYRGVGVGCEAQYLRSLSPNFPDGFCTLLIYLCICILVCSPSKWARVMVWP